MSQIQIAERYAKSLVELAQEKNLLTEVSEDMKSVFEVSKNSEFSSLMQSPVIYADKKIAIFKKLFEGKIESISLQFIELLINKGRENILAAICAAFIEQYKSIKKIKSARVISATELSDKELDVIKNKFAHWLKPGEVMELTQKVDAELIGGFILEMGDQNYDASIRRQLGELKDNLYDTSYISLVEKR